MIYSNSKTVINEEEIIQQLLSEGDDFLINDLSFLNEAMVAIDQGNSEDNDKDEKEKGKFKEWLTNFIKSLKDFFLNLLKKISELFGPFIAKLNIFQKISAKFYNDNIKSIEEGLYKNNWRMTGNLLLLGMDPSLVYYTFANLLTGVPSEILNDLSNNPWDVDESYGYKYLEDLYSKFNGPMKAKTKRFNFSTYGESLNSTYSPNFPIVSDSSSFRDFVMCILYHEDPVANYKYTGGRVGEIAGSRKNLTNAHLMHKVIMPMAKRLRSQILDICKNVVNDTNAISNLKRDYTGFKSDINKSLSSLKIIETKWNNELKTLTNSKDIYKGISNIKSIIQTITSVSKMNYILYSVCAKAVKDRLQMCLKAMKLWYRASQTDSIVYDGSISFKYDIAENIYNSATNESVSCFFDNISII